MSIGFVIVLLWVVQSWQPALYCGLVEAAPVTAWWPDYDCQAETPFEPLAALIALIGGALGSAALWRKDDASLLQAIGGYLQGASEAQRKTGNRREMIRRLRAIWIDGVLKNSLYAEVLLPLRMAKRPGVKPWGMTFQRHGVSRQGGGEQPLPAGMDMAAVFAEAHESLVILGAPGSGKSTMLLELARALLDRCEKDPAAPIPIVLNLSLQQSNYPSLDAWVIDELVRFYGVPKQTAAGWVQNNELALLLDGLDEVAEHGRAAVVAQINAFLRRDLLVPLAVCCREGEYAALAQQVASGGVVRLLPLSPAQIDSYLRGLADPAAAQIAAALAEDAALAELAAPPLLLNVMLLAAPELAAVDARTRVFDRRTFHLLRRDRAAVLRQEPDGSEQGRHQGRRRKAQAPPYAYTPHETVRRLQWLARKMAAQGQTVFLLERMGKVSLDNPYQWWIWLALFFGLFFGLVWGLLGGLIGGLVVGLFYGITDFLKHYLLRLVLWLDGSLPLRTVRFLDWCAGRVLLRRSGGYTFIHRTFQEYMVMLDIDRLELD